jgi:CheY-like chemotaxis protein
LTSQVLVVEDDAGIRDSLRDLLLAEVPDIEVVTATNGQEALDLLDAGSTPCLVLLDIVMPVMNGVEFLDALSKRPPATPLRVVIVSAYVSKYKDVDYPGIVGILPKPFRADDLVAAVERHCRADASA